MSEEPKRYGLEGVVFYLDPHRTYNERWVVYSIHIGDELENVHMDCCKLYDIENIPETKNHNKFLDTLGNTRFVSVKIHKLFDRKSQCEVFIRQFNHGKRPPFMNRFFASYNRQIGVICNETGEKFKTLKECARTHGIDHGNLSKHLRGEPNYKHIKGRTYRRSERKNVK